MGLILAAKSQEVIFRSLAKLEKTKLKRLKAANILNKSNSLGHTINHELHSGISFLLTWKIERKKLTSC